MNCDQIKELINDMFNLLANKVSGNITDLEKRNPGLLPWGCKQILENILFACNKLISKYNNDISNEEMEKYSNIARILENDKDSWTNNMGSIKNSTSKIQVYF